MGKLVKDIERWQKKAADRKEDGVFIVEGIKMFSELPKDRILHIVKSESFAKEHPEISTGLTVFDNEFQKISDTKTPQGILAVARAIEKTADEVLADSKGCFLILENIQDPGNLGTMFRSAEAAGISGLLISENSVDPTNPKVIRATMGSFLRVPYAVIPDVRETVLKIQSRGGTCYAAHLKGAVDYDTPDYRGLSAFVIGNESKGLTEETTAACHTAVKIPMAGHVESLNAAMAATILMFEAKRARKNG